MEPIQITKHIAKVFEALLETLTLQDVKREISAAALIGGLLYRGESLIDKTTKIIYLEKGNGERRNQFR